MLIKHIKYSKFFNVGQRVIKEIEGCLNIQIKNELKFSYIQIENKLKFSWNNFQHDEYQMKLHIQEREIMKLNYWDFRVVILTQ
jgi:hypothetical protein